MIASIYLYIYVFVYVIIFLSVYSSIYLSKFMNDKIALRMSYLNNSRKLIELCGHFLSERMDDLSTGLQFVIKILCILHHIYF